MAAGTTLSTLLSLTDAERRLAAEIRDTIHNFEAAQPGRWRARRPDGRLHTRSALVAERKGDERAFRVRGQEEQRTRIYRAVLVGFAAAVIERRAP